MSYGKRGLGYICLGVLVFFAVVLISPDQAYAWWRGKTCPEGFTRAGFNYCELNQDLTIEYSLVAERGVTYDCKGHSITPNMPGISRIVDDGGNVVQEFHPSVPDTAWVIEKNPLVTIKNCQVKDFDYGVVATHLKGFRLFPNLVLSQNTFDIRMVGIILAEVDHGLIYQNDLNMYEGPSVTIIRNSNLNFVLENNSILQAPPPGLNSTLGALPGAHNNLGFNPGPPGMGNRYVMGFPYSQGRAQLNIVFNAIDPDGSYNFETFEGQGLVSLPFKNDGDAKDYPQFNTFIDNFIDISAWPGASFACWETSDAAVGALIHGNTCVADGSFVGFFLDGQSTGDITATLSGTCSAKDRPCSSDADCRFLESEPGENGSCMDTESVTVSSLSRDLVVTENTLSGTGFAAIFMGQTDHALVAKNNLIGDFATNFLGIEMLEEARVNAKVIGNIVNGFFAGIDIDASGGSAPDFGAEIKLNDFSLNVNAVLVSPQDYDLDTQLTANYYGTLCDEGAPLPEPVTDPYFLPASPVELDQDGEVNFVRPLPEPCSFPDQI